MRWGTFLTAIYVRCDLKSIYGQRWWEQDRYDYRSHVLTQLMPRLNTSTRKGNHRPGLSTQGSSLHYFFVLQGFTDGAIGHTSIIPWATMTPENVSTVLQKPKPCWTRKVEDRDRLWYWSALMLGGVAAELCQKEETSRGGLYENSRPCYSMCSLSIPYSSCTCVYPNQSENILLFSFS